MSIIVIEKQKLGENCGAVCGLLWCRVEWSGSMFWVRFVSIWGAWVGGGALLLIRLIGGAPRNELC